MYLHIYTCVLYTLHICQERWITVWMIFFKISSAASPFLLHISTSLPVHILSSVKCLWCLGTAGKCCKKSAARFQLLIFGQSIGLCYQMLFLLWLQDLKSTCKPTCYRRDKQQSEIIKEKEEYLWFLNVCYCI